MPRKRQAFGSDSENNGDDEFQPKKKKKIQSKDVITIDSDEEIPKTKKPSPKKKEVQKNTLDRYFVFGTPKSAEKKDASGGSGNAKTTPSSKKASSEKLKLDFSSKHSVGGGGSPRKRLHSPTKPDGKPSASPIKLFLTDDSRETKVLSNKQSPTKPSGKDATTSLEKDKSVKEKVEKVKTVEKSETGMTSHKNVPPKRQSMTKSDDGDKSIAKPKPKLGEKRRSGGGNYIAYLNREGPREIGTKDIPEGSPNALSGLTFVLTGIMESMERDDAKQLIERCGGKVTTTVSKKTNYLVVGREPGISKVDKADQLKTAKMSEDELLDLIRSKTPKSEKPKEPQVEDETESAYFASPSKASVETAPKMSPSLKVKVNPADLPRTEPVSKEGRKTSSASTDSLLWVDKYRPRSLKQLIGQQQSGSNAQRLLRWLRNWHRHFNEGTKKSGSVGFTRGFSDDGSLFKAALLSGPPGIGKTTTATLVCDELGFSYVELNASDTRSKRSLREQVAESVGSHSVVDFLKNSTSNAGKLHCLLMDEVDGMAGNQDRGGIAELILLIRQSKIPIICMCNDRSHMKMRSLVNYCYDLRFQRPRGDQIKSAMLSIAHREGLKVQQSAIADIIAASNNDIRQTINNLEMWTASDKTMTEEQAKKDSSKAKKDMRYNAFELIRKILAPEATEDMSIHARSDLFFQDYQMGPLFVQENYLNVRPSSSGGDPDATLALMSKAADAIAEGDVVSRAIRSRNNWSLLTTQSLYSCVLPGHYMKGNFGAGINFPSWLGKFSSRKRCARLLQQLSSHIRLPTGGVKPLELAMGSGKALLHQVTDPLIHRGPQGVEDTIQIMRDYDLLREDLDILSECSLWPKETDPFAKIDSKTKAALTRAYNKSGILTPYILSTGGTKKGKARGGGGDAGEEGFEDDEGNEMDEDEGSDEDISKDAMVKKAKPPTSKTKAKTKAVQGEPASKKKKVTSKKK